MVDIFKNPNFVNAIQAIPSVYEYTYVACPYSHDDPNVREARYMAAVSYCTQELLKGHVVYSPIAHCHGMQVLFPDKLPTAFEFWRHIDFTMLSKAKYMHVLMLDGWKNSVGVKEEIDFCDKNNIGVMFIEWPN